MNCPDQRLWFCEFFFWQCVFGCLNDAINHHNCRNGSKENPHWVQTVCAQNRQKNNICAGIVNNRLKRPFFFDGSLTALRYLQSAATSILHDLIQAFPDAI